MASYVLVHGGAHGGWCYQRVAPLLRAAGHDVYAPTLTGLGERSHLLQPGIDLDYSEAGWKRAFECFQKFDVDAGVKDIAATIKVLRARPEANGKVGCIGYCLGGKLAYLTAARTDSDASVGYYGVGLDGVLEERTNIKKPLMLHIAEQDKFVPPEAQAKVKAALKGMPNVEVYSYPNVDHAFARFKGDHYDKGAADLANSRTLAFLKKHLGA